MDSCKTKQLHLKGVIAIITKNYRTLKDQKLRNQEYYNLTSEYDKLYSDSLEGKKFKNLMPIICSDNNIKLAFRNLKTNAGSNIKGCDKLTIKDLKKLSEEEILMKIKRKMNFYFPRKIKRVEIPKANGKTRPLGIPSIWDRLIQQCILQVLEPICEAKFNRHSDGFRPNKSAENALADCLQRINRGHLNYVVDIDIKSFFDEVNHTKLMNQLYTLGIQDKQLRKILRNMLKAPIELPNGKVIKPTKGTPQGGILSPLLANVYLNELDWWVHNQWEGKECSELKKIFNSKGVRHKSNTYSKLRKTTTLKEMYIVRYADDFKIFTNNYENAAKIYIATKDWLDKRLKLGVSIEKSKITNLKTNSSEYLGFSFKLTETGSKIKETHKYVARSHISNKALKNIKANISMQIQRMRMAKNRGILSMEIQKYNSIVIGIHNYFDIATELSQDLKSIGWDVKRKLSHKLSTSSGRNNRLGIQLQKGKPKIAHINKAIEPYMKSKQIIYLMNFPIIPIDYIRHKNPMMSRISVNKYTEQGRKEIHKNQNSVPKWKIRWMLENPVNNSSKNTIEYNDNRISLFIAQKGNCTITGEELELEDMHCHHKRLYKETQDDSYSNLILVTKEIHRIIHANKLETLEKYKDIINKLTIKQLKKLNELRNLVNNESLQRI